MKILLDESLVDGEHVPVEAGSSLWRGGGWFETLAVKEREVYNLQPHLDRLRDTLPREGVRPLNWDRLENSVRRLAGEWLRRPGRMKIVVWEDPSRFRSAAWIQPYEPPAREAYRSGVDLDVERRSHPPRWPLSDQKRTAYQPALTRREESSEWGVLYCDLEGVAWETGVANLIWFREGRIHTPTPDGHLLPGTVFEAVLEGADQLGVSRQFSQTSWEDIGPYAWVCNSLVGLLPVSSIGERSLETGEQTVVWNQLREHLHSDKVFPRWYDEE